MKPFKDVSAKNPCFKNIHTLQVQDALEAKKDGSVDYQSKKIMKKQEATSLMAKIINVNI